MILRVVFYTIAGYLAGSILFAPLAAALLGKGNIAENSADKNPGTTNAFRNGGFFCGLLTLIGDMAKGYLPVYLYLRETVPEGLGLALVLAAPVVGHIFPVFADFRGGKGIATTFGCLLGLGGLWEPAAILTGVFLLFSTIIRITPTTTAPSAPTWRLWPGWFWHTSAAALFWAFFSLPAPFCTA